jgi:hypothetical protein
MMGLAVAPRKTLSFLLYDSRSGSTLFAALLNRHAGVSVSLESAFVTRALDWLERHPGSYAAETLAEFLFEEPQFRELRLDRAEVLAALNGRGRQHHDVLESLIALCFSDAGAAARHWVIKHPPFEHLSELQCLIPGVRFIHLIRDGRAVYNSKRQTRNVMGQYMERNPLKASLEWRRKLWMARRSCKRYLEVRYEDLITATERTLERVLDFLDAQPGERRLARSQEDYARRIGDRQRHLHPHVERPPDPTLTDRWLNELPATHVALFERVCATELRALGYPLVARASAGGPRLWLMSTGCALGLAARGVRTLITRTVRERSVKPIVHKWMRRWTQHPGWERRNSRWTSDHSA